MNTEKDRIKIRIKEESSPLLFLWTIKDAIMNKGSIIETMDLGISPTAQP